MRIGYACLALGVPGSDLKTCAQRNADGPRLAALIAHNLKALERMVDYNLENGIRLYRISSDLIPFGSSPVNALDWAELFRADFARIGGKILAGRMRVSMHPGQYTVLSAPDEGVAARAADDLVYHARVLDALGTGADSKIILHLGGAYGDKASALERFEARFRLLDQSVRRRIVLENDDRLYTAEDVLNAGLKLNIPVVFDNLHHEANPSGPAEARFWIDAFRETWHPSDGPQKIHYSQQEPGKKPGAHSATIDAGRFLEFLDATGRGNLDIMLEVKDKNLSAVKCGLCASKGPNVPALEREWARYKYAVMERSQEAYQEIRSLFGRGDVDPLAFYALIEHALRLPVAPGDAFNAAQHVWGYFKDHASAEQRRSFMAAFERFQAGLVTLDAVKRRLYALAEEYDKPYLLQSYYFWL